MISAGVAGIPAFICITLANAMIEGRTKKMVQFFGGLWIWIGWIPFTILLTAQIMQHFND